MEIKTLEWQGFTLYPYGICAAAAALLALVLMQLRGGARGLRKDTVGWFGPLAVVLGVLCARIAYFLVSLPWFLDRGAGHFFAFTEGGYMLYGAFAGIALAALLAGRITQQPAGRILDAAAAPLALFTCLARLAEYWVGVGLGPDIDEWFDPEMGYTFFPMEDPSFFKRFPFGVQDAWEWWYFAVFVLEALAALVILIPVWRARFNGAGSRFLLFLGLYAALQATLESLRTDVELKWGFVKVNQLLLAPVIVLIAVCCILRTPRPLRKARRFLPSLCAAVLPCGVIMAMEFALEKKIGFLTWMRMDLCWLVMGLASCGIAAALWRMIRRSDPPKEAVE